MQMHMVGEIPAEKMRPYISKTIYMSIAHYSPVLNVIAAQLGMNSWNNKRHGLAVPGSCSHLMPALPPLCSSPASEGKKRLWRRKGSRDNSESQIPRLECVIGTLCAEKMCGFTTLVPRAGLYTCSNAQTHFARQIIFRQLRTLTIVFFGRNFFQFLIFI